MSDLYPIPVRFVDGQQPDAEMLNAWAAQIDRAFETVSGLLGGFNGGSGNTPNTMASLSGALGEMGFINSRLPRGLALSDGVSKPWIEEDLSAAAATSEREATLSFLPEAEDATEGTLITDSGLGAAQLRGADFVTENIGTPGLWCLDGRRVLTSSAIEAGDYVRYQVNTSEERYRDAFGPFNGPNIVPSIFEIYQDALLCTISAGTSVNEYFVDFPEVRRVANPYLSIDISEGIELSPGSGGAEWFGEIPKWPIPPYIYAEAASNGGEMPQGRADLWFRAGTPPGATTLSRVQPPAGEHIRFGIDVTSRTRVKLIVPEGTILPHAAGEEGQYIVAFSGTSIAEAIGHLHGMFLDHTHDTALSDRPINADDLARRFNPDNYSHGKDRDDVFPQYLSRKGYDDTDLINRRNAMLGDLLLGSSASSPSSLSDEPNSMADDSHGLVFGHQALGPRVFFSYDDDEDEVGGKLIFDRSRVRFKYGAQFGQLNESVKLRYFDAWPTVGLELFGGLLVESDGDDIGLKRIYIGAPHVSTKSVVFSSDHKAPHETEYAELWYTGLDSSDRRTLQLESESGDSVHLILDGDDANLTSAEIETEVIVAPEDNTLFRFHSVAQAMMLDLTVDFSTGEVLAINGPLRDEWGPNGAMSWLRHGADPGNSPNYGVGMAHLFENEITANGTRAGNAIGYIWTISNDQSMSESGPRAGGRTDLQLNVIDKSFKDILLPPATTRRASIQVESAELFESIDGAVTGPGNTGNPLINLIGSWDSNGAQPVLEVAGGISEKNSLSVIVAIEATGLETYENQYCIYGLQIGYTTRAY